MPDGDKVQGEIGGEYRKAYRQICDGKASDDDLAIGVTEATIKKIQKYGDEPIQILAKAAEICKEIQAHLPLFKNQINKAEKIEQFEKIAEQICMNKRAKHLAIRACRNQIEALFAGDNPRDVHVELLSKYCESIYRVDFEAFVESAPDHYRNAQPADVNASLGRMNPYVKARLLKVALQLQHQGGVKSLRQPVRYPGKSKGVPVETDLLHA